MFRNALYCFVALPLVLTLVSTSRARITEVVVTPSNPTSDSDITVTVLGYLPDGCWDSVLAGPVERSGDEIRAIANAYDGWCCGQGCLLYVRYYGYVFELGPLRAATYTLVGEERRWSLREPGSQIITQTLVVSPGKSTCVGTTGNVDCDLMERVDIGDLTVLIDHLFINFPPLECPDEGNVDGDPEGIVDVADLTSLIDHLFINFPPTAVCG